MTSPRIPDETHKAKGTYQPCRHGNPDEKPQFPDYTGDAPKGLPDEAAAEWQRIVPILSAAGMLKQTDLALLTSYCLLFGIVQRDRYNCDIKNSLGSNLLGQSMNLLIQDAPHVFSPHLAKEIGLHECLMLQQLHWLIQNNNCKYHDDHFWWKHTNAQWLDTLPYFQNEKRVLKTVKSLRSQNLLIAETLTWKIEKIRGDRTLWYRVNYQEVERLSKEIETRKLQKKINSATAKNQPVAP